MFSTNPAEVYEEWDNVWIERALMWKSAQNWAIEEKRRREENF